MKLTCPSEDRLRDFLEGSVNDAEADQISDHLEDCSACNSVISKLESDQDHAIQKLRDGLRLESLLDEPELSYLRKTVVSSLPDSASAIDQEANGDGGKRLRDYRLVKKIGEGGMGTVYQAVHVHLGKSVALKILPTDKLRSKHSVERFRQEMRAVGKVNHPNVVSASDAGAVDGQHFLVMELVEGADLARIIHDRGSLNVADACEIVRQAAIGLQHAHDIGLVHRDVRRPERRHARGPGPTDYNVGMNDERSFHELLAELRSGDEDAARQIVDQYTDALVAVARKQMGAKLARRVDPEDIVQSTYRSLFVRVQKGEYELGGGSDLWKLMVTIALNKVRRKSKFHRASKRDMQLEQSRAADATSPFVRDARATGPTPDDAAALVDQLQTVLQDVPDRDRAIVELRLQGCSTKEIADETGRAERSVRRVLQHLGQRLQKSIEE